MAVKFTKDHEWVSIEGDVATVGITDHAQSALGDVVFVEVPDVGRKVAQHEAVAVVESVKAASEVFAPLSGEVVAATAISPAARPGQRGCPGQGLVLQAEDSPTNPNSTA